MSRTLGNNQNNGVFFYISNYEDNNNDTRQYCRIFTFTLAIVLLTGLGQWTCHEHQSEVVEHLPEVYISQMICNCSKPPNRYVYENTSESVVCLSKWSSLYTLLFCVYSVNIQTNDLITNKDLENNRLYFSINVKNIEMHIIGVY